MEAVVRVEPVAADLCELDVRDRRLLVDPRAEHAERVASAGKPIHDLIAHPALAARGAVRKMSSDVCHRTLFFERPDFYHE